MNNLVQIREKIKRAERLHKANLLVTKNGKFVNYRRSVYEERVNQAQKDLVKEDS